MQKKNCAKFTNMMQNNWHIFLNQMIFQLNVIFKEKKKSTFLTKI